jgi:ATP-dependent DNA ligase
VAQVQDQPRSRVIGAIRRGNPFDAIIFDGQKLFYAGKVRAEFVLHARRDVLEKILPLETDACPFANFTERKRTQWALTREEMKNCIWLVPELVAQIEFTEWTPDGHLRHASFSGLRVDKCVEEVVRESG